jgi:hypothetical protein
VAANRGAFLGLMTESLRFRLSGWRGRNDVVACAGREKHFVED